MASETFVCNVFLAAKFNVEAAECVVRCVRSSTCIVATYVLRSYVRSRTEE